MADILIERYKFISSLLLFLLLIDLGAARDDWKWSRMKRSGSSTNSLSNSSLAPTTTAPPKAPEANESLLIAAQRKNLVYVNCQDLSKSKEKGLCGKLHNLAAKWTEKLNPAVFRYFWNVHHTLAVCLLAVFVLILTSMCIIICIGIKKRRLRRKKKKRKVFGPKNRPKKGRAKNSKKSKGSKGSKASKKSTVSKKSTTSKKSEAATKGTKTIKPKSAKSTAKKAPTADKKKPVTKSARQAPSSSSNHEDSLPIEVSCKELPGEEKYSLEDGGAPVAGSVPNVVTTQSKLMKHVRATDAEHKSDTRTDKFKKRGNVFIPMAPNIPPPRKLPDNGALDKVVYDPTMNELFEVGSNIDSYEMEPTTTASVSAATPITEEAKKTPAKEPPMVKKAVEAIKSIVKLPTKSAESATATKPTSLRKDEIQI